MNFDFDDNLLPSKRKNVNPARFTNLLIICGFVVLAGLMAFFMNKSQPASISEADIQATVDTRVTRALENIPDNSEATEVAIAVIPATPAPIATEAQPLVKQPVIIEGQELVDGVMVKGTITDSKFEHEYFYEGQAGTAIVITMTGEGTDTYFEEPVILLTAPNGRKVVTTVGINQPSANNRQALIAVVLPFDGVYTITASRKDGRVGKQIGNFNLNLEVPPMLEVGENLEDVVEGNGHWNWYVYQSDQPFGVIYQHLAGSYLPEIGIYTLNAAKELQGIGYLTGDKTSFGQLGWYDSDMIYFISVGEHSPALETELNATGQTASYQIGAIHEPKEKNYQLWCVPACQ